MSQSKKKLWKAEHCRNCPDRGYYMMPDKNGEPEPHQCEFCHANVNSVFNQKRQGKKVYNVQRTRKRKFMTQLRIQWLVNNPKTWFGAELSRRELCYDHIKRLFEMMQVAGLYSRSTNWFDANIAALVAQARKIVMERIKSFSGKRTVRFENIRQATQPGTPHHGSL